MELKASIIANQGREPVLRALLPVATKEVVVLRNRRRSSLQADATGGLGLVEAVETRWTRRA